MLRQLGAETGTVEAGQRRHLTRFETRVEQRDEPRDVGRIENNHHMPYVGAISPQVLAELGGDRGVALEQIFARHAGLTGRSARRHDVAGAPERLGHIARIGQIHALESAVEHLLGHAFQRGSVGIVCADVRCQAHHDSRLDHVRSDHAGCADDRQFLFRQKIHFLRV